MYFLGNKLGRPPFVSAAYRQIDLVLFGSINFVIYQLLEIIETDNEWRHLLLDISTKTVTEYWVIEAPSAGTILAYLETMTQIIFFKRIKLFCFSRQKAEIFSICLKRNFMKPHHILAHSDNFYFHFLYRSSELKFGKISQKQFSNRC